MSIQRLPNSQDACLPLTLHPFLETFLWWKGLNLATTRARSWSKKGQGRLKVKTLIVLSKIKPSFGLFQPSWLIQSYLKLFKIKELIKKSMRVLWLGHSPPLLSPTSPPCRPAQPPSFPCTNPCVPIFFFFLAAWLYSVKTSFQLKMVGGGRFLPPTLLHHQNLKDQDGGGATV